MQLAVRCGTGRGGEGRGGGGKGVVPWQGGGWLAWVSVGGRLAQQRARDERRASVGRMTAQCTIERWWAPSLD